MSRNVLFKVKRTDKENQKTYWQEYIVSVEPKMTVLDALKKINNEFIDESNVKKIVLDDDCKDESCGRCSMVINGKARLACKTFIERVSKPIIIEPLTKFNVIEDLKVDRSVLYDLKKSYKTDLNLPEISNSKLKSISSCIMCGCCIEACPRCNPKTHFIGPAILGQIYLYNSFSNQNDSDFRLNKLMKQGGIAECMNVKNCDNVCPKRISLNDSIAALNWQTTVYSIKNYFRE